MKSFALVMTLALIVASMAPAQEIGSALPENTTVLLKTAGRARGGNPWTERIIMIKSGDTLSAMLRDLGATPEEIKAIAAVLGVRGRDGNLKEGERLRVLQSPVRGLQRLQPVRIMLIDDQDTEAIVALSDLGRYVRVEAFGLSEDVLPHPDGGNVVAKSDRLASAELPLLEGRTTEAALPVVESTPEEPSEIPAALAPPIPTGEVSQLPFDHSPAEVSVKPWPNVPDPSPSERYAPLDEALQVAKSAAPCRSDLIACVIRDTQLTAERYAALPPPTHPDGPSRQKLTLPVLDRPAWAWPPGRFWWALAPGLPSVSWTWRAGRQPVLLEMIRIASRVELPAVLQAKLPAWVGGTSVAMVAAESVPPWPRVRTPDFRLPKGPSRVASTSKYLEPPARFVRWSDRLETVLSEAREVDRRCRTALGRSPPAGKVYRGCAQGVAGRCFITRVDDPGVARHELAHCNGWKHPE